MKRRDFIEISYSLIFMCDIQSEYVGCGLAGYVNPCIFITSYADVEAYVYLEELGDLDPDDPLHNFARTAVAGISVASFRNCN